MEDTTGELGPQEAWRLAELYRPTWDAVAKQWTMRPISVRPGMSLCPNDVLETWQGATSTVNLRARGLGDPVGAITGHGGSVLSFDQGHVHQERGTAQYLFPDDLPDLAVLASMGGGRSLRADQGHSSFQVSVGDGCSPEVDVAVSPQPDPWQRDAPPDAAAHSVRLQVLGADDRPIGPPLLVKGSQVGRLPAGASRPKIETDDRASALALGQLGACQADLRRPLASRQAAPVKDDLPVLGRTYLLQVQSPARPERVEVDGQPWAPRGWWGSKDESGERVWEASRKLDLAIGPHQIVVRLREGDPAIWSGTSEPPGAGEEGVPIIGVAAPMPVTAPEKVAVPAAQPGAGGAPTGQTWTTTAIPDAPMRFVGLSGGIFQMGSPDGVGSSDEHPQHPVTVSGFGMGVSEVTQAQWRAVVAAAQQAKDPDAAELNADPAHFKGDTLPVESVSWCDVARFANALSRLEGRTPAYTVGADCEKGGDVAWDRNATGFRLPTEAEWEYAARAGTATAYATGEAEADLARAGWYDGNSGNKTHAVCTAAEKPWGLCDLAGNVSEWTWDWYQDYHDTGVIANPAGPHRSGNRVLRGGSLDLPAVYARSASRSGSVPTFTYVNVGFRLVLPVAASEP